MKALAAFLFCLVLIVAVSGSNLLHASVEHEHHADQSSEIIWGSLHAIASRDNAAVLLAAPLLVAAATLVIVRLLPLVTLAYHPHRIEAYRGIAKYRRFR